MTIRGRASGRWFLATLILAIACRGEELPPRTASVVDSAVPRDTSIARFQRGLPRVQSLQGGAASMDELVRSFARAVETRDTAMLHRLALTKSEFGWLYYPTNPEGLPPYNLTPQLMWFTLEGHSARGLTRLLRARGGAPLHVVGQRCEGQPGRHGGNTVFGPCVVLRRVRPADTVAERLFGQVVERDGRFKFVSYSNKLD